MAGRPPKTKEEKALKGTLRPSRVLEPSVKLEKLGAVPLAPTDLPAIGQQEWLRAVRQLQPLGVLTDVDLSLLKSYCHHVATMELAAANLASEGYTITMFNKGGGSYAIKSPWVTIYNEASDRAAKLGQQFGFTPSSRTRIVVPGKGEKEENPWDSL